MSLRNKIALVLFVAVSVLVSIDRVLNHFSFVDRFVELDEDQAFSNLHRAQEMVRAQMDELALAARALEAKLLDRESGVSAEAVLPEGSLANLQLHFALTFDDQGIIGEHHILHPVTGKYMPLRELPTEQLSPSHPLMREWAVGKPPSGFWITSQGALLVYSVEVGIGEGSPKRLVAGRFLDEHMLEHLRSAAGDKLEVTIAKGLPLSAQQAEILSKIAIGGGPYIEDVDDQTLHAWTTIRGLGDQPALLLRAECARTHAILWADLQRYAISSTVLIVIAFPLVILLILQRIVTGPLAYLTRHASRVGQNQDMDVRLNLSQHDEIGQLACEFDGMLEKLETSREEVVRSARLAGKSEISAGVLHNVGNVLNSVKISADISRQRVVDLDLSDLEMIHKALETNAGSLDTYLSSHEQGQHLMPFFSALTQDLRSGKEGALEELGALADSADYIASLLQTLSDTDLRASVVERTNLSKQFDLASELCVLSLDSKLPLEIVREFEDLPSVMIDRHKLNETLLKLIHNALQAMQASDSDVNRLTLDLSSTDSGQIRFAITDTGIGIAGEDQTRIFIPGQTTNENRMGFGLHLAANTASEMGGSLSVESDGPGSGATFVLLVPMSADRRAA